MAPALRSIAAHLRWLAPCSSPAPPAPPPKASMPAWCSSPRGSSPWAATAVRTRKGPAHKLFLPAFHIDRNLVTMKEYARFIQAKGSGGAQGRAVSGLGGRGQSDPPDRRQVAGRAWLGGPPPPRNWRCPAQSRIASGWRNGSPAKRSGRRPRAAPTAGCTRGATTRRPRNWPSSAAGAASPCPWAAIPRDAVPTASWTWPARYGSGLAPPRNGSYPYDPQGRPGGPVGALPRGSRGAANTSSGPEGLTATSRHSVDPGRQARGHAYYGFRCSSRVEMVF